MRYNKRGYKWYVVDVQKMCIDSGWEHIEDATQRAKDMADSGECSPGAVKVQTKPRVGSVKLDPNDDGSWVPKRKNPANRRDRVEYGGAAERIRDEDVEPLIERHPVLGTVVRPRDPPQGVYQPPLKIRNIESNTQEPDIGSLWRERSVQPVRVWTVKAVERDRVKLVDFTGDVRRVPLVSFYAKYTQGEPVANPRLNPEPDSDRAKKLFQLWHKKDPKRVRVFKPGVHVDDVMCRVGRAHDIVYRSGKWEKGSKKNDYVHHFGKPSVWMLADALHPDDRSGKCKTFDAVVSRRSDNADGQIEVAELAAPLSITVDDDGDGYDIPIHSGAKVYGAVDKKTIIIEDSGWGLIVIVGGKMRIDERGIVD